MDTQFLGSLAVSRKRSGPGGYSHRGGRAAARLGAHGREALMEDWGKNCLVMSLHGLKAMGLVPWGTGWTWLAVQTSSVWEQDVAVVCVGTEASEWEDGLGETHFLSERGS